MKPYTVEKSKIRTTVETMLFQNNIEKVCSLKEAYHYARLSPGTIDTKIPIYNPEYFGMPNESNVLLFNDGNVTGRTADARRIIGDANVNIDEIAGILREDIYELRNTKLYHTKAYVGLDESFMLKAQLIIPQGHENLLYNWLLNFQPLIEEYNKLYMKSDQLSHEGDILVYCNPDWKHPDYPLGLAIFDPETDTAAILGMRYFGELKKGTLTLAWRIASRNNFVPCHGGIKSFDKKYIMAFFGLSGSGKLTLTHDNHNGKYEISILHDDAFVIRSSDGASTALEPSYFDKTQDYPYDSPANKYLLTIQNVGMRFDDDEKPVLVTEDIRNGNGRAIKSILWNENRVNYIEEKIDAIVWLMKDPTLPPVIKINDPILASTMGATLATKRSTAERLSENRNLHDLVIEPYANPFRTHSLKEDYENFKNLFQEQKVQCYIFNTGHFITKKITKETTIKAIEDIVDQKAEFEKFCYSDFVETMIIPGFEVKIDSPTYAYSVTNNLKKRIEFLSQLSEKDQLPQEASIAIENLILRIDSACI
ncbi:MAG: phosphoenolpyruvate carboxykinase (ATP) [Clostridiales bacterium]|nr:phosphoenolpyruvate carboxykinase (ATP) [Clostridiales bacterium]